MINSLPITLKVPSTEETKTGEETKSFEVSLFRSMSISRQIQIMLYQTKLFTNLDSLLCAGEQNDPVLS
jgi:hypothetical protein